MHQKPRGGAVLLIFDGFVPGVGFRVAWSCLVDGKIYSIFMRIEQGPKNGDLGAWRTGNRNATDNTGASDHPAYFLTLSQWLRGGANKGSDILYDDVSLMRPILVIIYANDGSANGACMDRMNRETINRYTLRNSIGGTHARNGSNNSLQHSLSEGEHT